MRAPLLAAALLAPLAAPAQEGPRPLTFTSGADRYEVPADGFESIDYKETVGLELCLKEPVEREVSDFTEAHMGEIVHVAVGDLEVIVVEIVTPYEGGCIAWPVHPVVAANYVAMLTGGGRPTPLPPTAVGE